MVPPAPATWTGGLLGPAPTSGSAVFTREADRHSAREFAITRALGQLREQCALRPAWFWIAQQDGFLKVERAFLNGNPRSAGALREELERWFLFAKVVADAFVTYCALSSQPSSYYMTKEEITTAIARARELRAMLKGRLRASMINYRAFVGPPVSVSMPEALGALIANLEALAQLPTGRRQPSSGKAPQREFVLKLHEGFTKHFGAHNVDLPAEIRRLCVVAGFQETRQALTETILRILETQD